MSSASAVSEFSSSSEDSVLVSLTSSTLENWWRRMKPRVSFPAAPASDRQQGEYMTYLIGSLRPSSSSSRCQLVSGTSAVGTSQRSRSASRKAWSPNLGRLAVPTIASLLTRKGVCISV